MKAKVKTSTPSVVLLLLLFGVARVLAQSAEEQSAVMTPLSTGGNRLGSLTVLPPNFKFGNICDLLQTPHRRLLSPNAELALMRRCGEPPPQLSQGAPLGGGLEGPKVAAPIANASVNDPSADKLPNQTTQSETTIAKDPVTGNLIIGWNDSGNFTGAPGDSFTGWGVSTNGGATWTDMGPFPPLTSSDWSLGDPSLATHNATGSVYFATLACAASSCGLEKLEVAKSTNGGLTFPQRVNPVPFGFWDKALIAVDNTGGTSDGNLYLVATDFTSVQIKFVRSTNGGTTWSAPVVLNPGHAGCDTGAFPFVGPDGTIYVAWQDFGCIGGRPGIEITKSTDGGLTWWPFVTVSLADFAQDDTATAFCRQSALSGNIRITNFPQVGTSPSNSNQVYVTWNAKASASDDADVYFSRSTNGGATWSAPTRLNDDSGTSDQFMPALNVALDGTILVTWYDRREDSANLNMRPWGALSFDGGLSFTSNFPVGNTLFPPAVNFDPQIAPCYMGDYNWITHDPANNFHIAWGDNRNMVGSRHDPDIFYASFPTAGPGAILALEAELFDDTTGGDGDGMPEPGETVNVTITIEDIGRKTATGVAGTLSTTTLGVTVTQASSAYPDVSLGGSASNATPFTFSVDPAVKLGTLAQFVLDVTTATEGSFSLSFGVRLGMPPTIGFLYTNDDGSPNTVSGFSVSTEGTLTPVPGSPFSTGGIGNFGGFFAAPRIRAVPGAGLLYASNAWSNNVSGFTIASDGSLTPVPGSPFPTGLSSPQGIAINPLGTCLFVGALYSTGLTAFSINPDGRLAFVETESTGNVVDDLRVTPDGSFLVATFPYVDQVGVFAIDFSCRLSPVPGSPFPAGSGSGDIAGIEFNATGDRLFGGIANLVGTTVDEYRFSVGVPSPITGSPFVFPGHGINSNVVRLNPWEDRLFVTNQASSSVAVLDIALNGSLAPIVGSPFPAPGAIYPSGEAIAPDGTLLFVADYSNAIYIYDIAPDGSLAMVDGSPFPTGARGRLLSLDFVPVALPGPFSLGVTKAGTGSGNVTSSPAGIDCGSTCLGSFNKGTLVTLTATASAGSVFAGWSGGGCSGTSTCAVTMNADTTVAATFARRFTLTISKGGTGSGTVTSNPAGINCGGTCSAAYDSGTVVTLTAAPDSVSVFSGWSGGGCSGTGTCSVTMTADTTVTATLTKKINVTSPNGGESWAIGSTHAITWTSIINGKVNILLSRDGGASFTTLFSNVANKVGSNNKSWKVTKPATKQGRIRICSVNSSSVCDTSDNNFTIQ